MIINGMLVDEADALNRLKEFYRLDAQVASLQKLQAETQANLDAAMAERDRLKRELVGD